MKHLTQTTWKGEQWTELTRISLFAAGLQLQQADFPFSHLGELHNTLTQNFFQNKPTAKTMLLISLNMFEDTRYNYKKIRKVWR